MAQASTGLVTQLANFAIDKGTFSLTSNLASLSKGVRVEPFHIVNNELVNYGDIDKVTSTLLSLFSAYYLQATSALVNLSSAFVRDILTATSTNVPLGLAIENEMFTHPEKFRFSLENAVTSPSAIKDIPTPTNLAIGKLIEVAIEDDNGKQHKIPVSIRFMTTITSPRVTRAIVSRNSEDVSFTERFERWRAGHISFWKDLVLCQDLIKARQKTLLEDETGILMNIEERKRKGTLIGLFKTAQKAINNSSGVGAYAAGARSNLLTITKNDQIAIEGQTGQKFSNRKYMNELMSELGLIILTVVDTEKDRVTFYQYGTDAPATVTIRELKIQNKKGQEILEMVKLLSSGVSPLA